MYILLLISAFFALGLTVLITYVAIKSKELVDAFILILGGGIVTSFLFLLTALYK